LGELIRYLEHPKSGALEFEDMGQNWVPVREAVSSGILRASDKALPEVLARFDALLRYASLRLGRQLGTEVAPVLSRKEQADPSVRVQSLKDSLVNGGQLLGALKIPNAIGPVTLSADLRAGQVSAHIDVDAPREGRPTTRVNWLVRQLKDADGGLRVEAFSANQRGSGAAELLKDVRENPAVLVLDPTKDLKSFRVTKTIKMGTKSGRGRGGFIDSVLEVLDDFYAEVVQQLRPWTSSPPKMRKAEELGQPEAGFSSTALSSQDGTDVACAPVLEISDDADN